MYPIDKPNQLSEQLDVIFLYVDVGQDSYSIVVFVLKKILHKKDFFFNLRRILAIYLDTGEVLYYTGILTSSFIHTTSIFFSFASH